MDISEIKEDVKKNVINDKAHLYATVTVSRKSGFYVSNAFFLILLINSMSLAIFSIDCKLVSNRLSVTMGLLLASVSLKQSTNRNIPTVSYLTALDTYSLISIGFLCAEAIWYSLIGFYWVKPLATDIDKWVFISFAIFYGIFNVIFLTWLTLYRYKLKKFVKKEKEFLKSFDI